MPNDQPTKDRSFNFVQGTSYGLFGHTWAFDASLSLYENLKTITRNFA